MSQKSKKRNLFTNFIWYASGLSLRDLSGLTQSKTNYFAIGGVNIFITTIVFLLSSWSFHLAFPKVISIIYYLLGITLGIIVFTFNRQTIHALCLSETTGKNQRLSIALIPIVMFSVFFGTIISTPLKFYLFDIPITTNIMESISELDKISDASVSSKISSWSLTVFLVLIITLPTLIKYYSLQNSNQKKRSNFLNELMWFCSGANKDIVRKCPNEYSKYFGIGGTILFTALMATLSGGYAFYTAFDNATTAIFFGLFWGALIFNLDRFIVNTMYSDGEASISWKELLGGLPRLIIAVFLGIVISTPLELKVFDKEILVKISELKNEKVKGFNKDNQRKLDSLSVKLEEVLNTPVSQTIFQSGIVTGSATTNQLLSDRNNKESERSVIQQKINSISLEINTLNTDDNSPEKNTLIEERGKLLKQRNSLTQEINTIDGQIKISDSDLKKVIADAEDQKKAQINDIQTQIKILRDKIDKGEKGYIEDLKEFNGLQAKMEAFSAIREENHSTDIAAYFIMFLFIIIEIAPVLFKMMITSGDYEVIQNAERNEIKISAVVRISERNDWANTEITKLIEENKKKILAKQNELNAELNSNHELLLAIAKAQAEIAQVAINQWKEQEMKKALENPESFIKINNSTNNNTI